MVSLYRRYVEELTNTNFAASDDVTEVGDFLLETDGVDGTVYFIPEKLQKWKGRAFLADESGNARAPSSKKYANGGLVDIAEGGADGIEVGGLYSC